MSQIAVDRPGESSRAAPERPPGGRGFWFSDFRIAGGRVTVFDTGADLPLDRTLVGEALVWFAYHVVVRGRSWWMGLVRRDRPSIWFTPQRPRPWYLVWSALAWTGMRLAASLEGADAVFAFEDVTWAGTCLAGALPAFNARCTDVSKSRVAEVFEKVFDYPLAIEPQTWTGPAVEKGEINGAHDGRVVACPAPALAGRHYQRLVDTSDGAFTYDLRTACIGGRPVAVWVKRKPKDAQFSIHNLSVEMRAPETVFSPVELAQIARFLDAMGIDWAGLDVLRDRHSGRIYVVDVNKTDVGPIIALPFRDKIRSTVLLARALEDMVARRRGAGR